MVLGIDLTTAILFSVIVVTPYTMAGGMWAVAYTDAVQLCLVVVGLAVALPVALDAVGGLSAAWHAYQVARPEAAVFVPPVAAVGELWTRPAIVSWWDVSIMLMAVQDAGGRDRPGAAGRGVAADGPVVAAAPAAQSRTGLTAVN